MERALREEELLVLEFEVNNLRSDAECTYISGIRNNVLKVDGVG